MSIGAEPCVLYFHHIGPLPDYRWVSPQHLKRQLQWLMERRTAATLDNAAAIGSATFCVTFDDGYDDVLEALPILDALSITATFFVLPAYFGRTSGFTGGLLSKHLSQADVKFLSRSGHGIGSHGLLHRNLTALGEDELTAELVQSRKMLEDIIGTSVPYFAYPYGLCNDYVVEQCLRHYKDAWSTGAAKALQGGQGRLGCRSRVYMDEDPNGTDYIIVR